MANTDKIPVGTFVGWICFGLLGLIAAQAFWSWWMQMFMDGLEKSLR